MQENCTLRRPSDLSYTSLPGRDVTPLGAQTPQVGFVSSAPRAARPHGASSGPDARHATHEKQTPGAGRPSDSRDPPGVVYSTSGPVLGAPRTAAATILVRVYASIALSPFSLPSPLAFQPPNGNSTPPPNEFTKT